KWLPAVCIAGPAAPQSIEDVQFLEAESAQPLTDRSDAAAFLAPGENGVDPHSGEIAALAVWGGRDVLTLSDGSLALSRRGAAAVKGKVAAGPVLKRARRAAQFGKLRQ